MRDTDAELAVKYQADAFLLKIIKFDILLDIIKRQLAKNNNNSNSME